MLWADGTKTPCRRPNLGLQPELDPRSTQTAVLIVRAARTGSHNESRLITRTEPRQSSGSVRMSAEVLVLKRLNGPRKRTQVYTPDPAPPGCPAAAPRTRSENFTQSEKGAIRTPVQVQNFPKSERGAFRILIRVEDYSQSENRAAGPVRTLVLVLWSHQDGFWSVFILCVNPRAWKRVTRTRADRQFIGRIGSTCRTSEDPGPVLIMEPVRLLLLVMMVVMKVGRTATRPQVREPQSPGSISKVMKSDVITGV